MRDYDEKGRSVENVKNEHYVAMPNSWEARNNRETNIAMGYNNMTDITNTAHPSTTMQGAKRNVQLSPDISRLNNYNYNKKR